jgi:polysaccharide biosynthesis family protein
VQFILLSSILFPLLYTMTEVTGIGINVSRKTWLVTVISVIALAANFALCRLLVPAFGAKGAAASMAVSFWLYFALKTEASVLLWQKLPRTKIYGTTLICLFSCLAYTFWGNRGNYPLFAAGWAAALAGIGFAYRTQLVLLAERIAGRLKKAA